jgi:AcrR family transcriptional regulator
MSKGDETRQTILDEAVRRASVEGLEGLSIGQLASELGMSKSGLFAHFRSKENLQLATLEAGEHDFIEGVIKPALKEPRGEPRIRALVHNWYQWGHVSGPPGGCVFVSAIVEFDDRPGPVRDTLKESQARWVDTVARAASIAVDVGDFRSDLDPRQFAFELVSVMMATNLFGRLLQDERTLEYLSNAVERLFRDARAD